MWGKHEGFFLPGPLAQRLVDALKREKGALDSLMEVKTYMEEFVFQTWLYHHRREIKDGSELGLQTVATLTVTHIYGNDNPEHKFATPAAIWSVLDAERSKPSGIYGIKAVPRQVVDYHGTRAYIAGLAFHEKELAIQAAAPEEDRVSDERNIDI